VVALSPDGRWLATGWFDSTRIWDTRRGKQLQTLTYDSSVRLVAFSPDGRRLATSTFDGTTWIWEVSSGERLQTLTHDRSGVQAVVFSSDGRWLATSSFNSTRIWDTSSGGQLHTITLTDDSLGIQAVAFSPDGRWLATGTSHSGVVLWELMPPSRPSLPAMSPAELASAQERSPTEEPALRQYFRPRDPKEVGVVRGWIRRNFPFPPYEEPPKGGDD
jgi:WD40 repeat protein